MTHYEVHRLNQDRWLLDGVFEDKSTAIEDAKSLMARARALVAVRVLKVEEQQEGFVEWIVYDRDSATPRHAPSQRFLPLLRAPARVRRAVIRRSARRIVRQARERSSVLALVTLLALAAVLVFLAQVLEPKEIWLFDRPEARAPHTLHNPWTGEASK
jgi:hypothetical protein